ncbi:hypothetical protein F2Q70_00045340 [Brassica cretica]|uniref:RRM domain-containing protein n=1 Tax=Brassica cretica TaxID=69181 RepID=A0A8S9KIG3_BRACR|nr:hypothetical protein F2Q70_00045340 [Brassica cretica]
MLIISTTSNFSLASTTFRLRGSVEIIPPHEMLVFSFFAWESRALVTFTTREGAEKAFQALSKFLFIDDQRLKLAWATPLEVGGSSNTENNDASSNIPIICQYCRATAAAVENESDTSQMLHRLSMLKHYQSPSWHVNQNTNAL